MPASQALIDRTIRFKRELVALSQDKRYRADLGRALVEAFPQGPPKDQGRLAFFFDSFILTRRLSDGRTIVEHYVDNNMRTLTKEEREMLLGWRNGVEAIFEVKDVEGDAVILNNLIDEMDYHVRSNVKGDLAAMFPVGSFLFSRIVPIADEWLLSGVQQTYRQGDREKMLALAAQMAARFPEAVYRNPDKLAAGWERQRAERDAFIQLFGSDEVIVPGAEAVDKLKTFLRWQVFERKDKNGTTAAERSAAIHGRTPDEPNPTLPEPLTQAETVGLIYDEKDGLSLYANYGKLTALFENPEHLADRDYREVARRFLDEPSVSPVPLERLAARYPNHATRIFRSLLKEPKFEWERDGERTLRRLKSQYYRLPHLPKVVVLSEAQTRALAKAMPSSGPITP